MRIPALTVVVLLMMAGHAAADDMRPRHRGNGQPEVFVDVPLQYDTSVVFPFGGSHHAVPGVATINTAPYFCRVHKLAFRERAAFIEHLGVKHGLTDREIPSMVLVEHNQVRYVGD